MRPLFVECFHTVSTTTSTERSIETTVESEKSGVWVIIAIIVTIVVIILIIIGCLCCWKYRRNRSLSRYWKLHVSPSTTETTSKITPKSSVGSDAKHPAVRVESSNSVGTQRSVMKKTKNEPNVKTSPKLTNNSTKQKVSPKK